MVLVEKSKGKTGPTKGRGFTPRDRYTSGRESMHPTLRNF